LDDKNMKLYQAHIVEGKEGKPGEIIETTKKAIIVGTGSSDAIALTDIQLSGKKRMPTANFLSGYQDDLVGKELN
ncbi:MAG: methionyl-tRNA formyltransferase, partial [Staphylococcus simulans]|nr:methionyl-tRNA formyltransferase [Staphylococcus simulans]